MHAYAIQLNVGFERLAAELVNNTYNVCKSIATKYYNMKALRTTHRKLIGTMSLRAAVQVRRAVQGFGNLLITKARRKKRARRIAYRKSIIWLHRYLHNYYG